MRIARRRPVVAGRSVSRRSLTRSAIDTLESRRLLTNTPFALASGQLTQNWSTTSIFTTTGSGWAGVPSFQGFRGVGVTGIDPTTGDFLIKGTGTEGQTIQAINTSATGPNTITNGGTVYFSGISNPTIALAGSGSAPAPQLVAYLNTVGVTNIRVKYTVRDLEDGADNATQPVNLQYSTDGTNWVNVAGAYIADATDGPNLAKADQPVDVTITDAAALNQTNLLLRWVTVNAAGNDEYVGIDDIVIGDPVTTPVFTVSSSPTSAREGEGPYTITINRAGAATANPVSVLVSTANGTAVAGSDYTAVSQTVTWAGNDLTPKTISLNLVNDAVAEVTESFSVQLSNASSGTLIGSPSSVTLTVVDDDQVLPANPVVVNEVNANPPGTDGSNEYIEIRGTPGQSLFGVKLLVVKGNPLSTPNGAGGIDTSIDLSGFNIGSSGYLVIKSTTGGPTIPSGTTVVTNSIFDNTASVVGGIRDDSVSFALVFNKDPISSGIDLDATDGGTLTLPAGSTVLDAVGYRTATTATLRAYGADLTVNGGANAVGSITRFSDNLTANTDVSGASNPSAVAAWAAGTIQGTDPTGLLYDPTTGSANLATVVAPALTPGAQNFAPTTGPGALQFTVSAFNVFENVGTITFTVSRTGGSAGAVSANWATVNGTAAAPGDFVAGSGTVNFAAGDSTPQTFTVTVNNDTLAEGAEAFTVVLSSPTGGATLGANSTATVNIGASDQTAPVVINEVLIDPPGNDAPGVEWIELRGTPGLNVGGYYVLGVEGDAGTTIGQANLVLQLPVGTLIGSNGLLLIRGATTPASVEPGTTVVTFAAFDTGTSGIIQNGTQSIILVNPGSNTFASAQVIGNTTGTLTLPSGATLLDSVGWRDTAATTDYVYGGVDLTQLTATGTLAYSNQAVSRFVDEGTPSSGGAWFGGTLQTAAPTLYQPTFVSGNPASFNLPTGTGSPNITPGGTNYPGIVGDTTPPTVVGTPVRNYLTGLNVQITFSEDVSASLAAGDFTLTNTTTSTVIPAANINVAYNTTTNVATLTFTGIAGFSAGNRLPNGNYTLEFGGTPNAIEDAAGNDLAANSFNFRFVNGDTTQNGTANFDDLLALAANYNTAPGVNYALGDFNYDGNVNFDDLLILAANYNVSIPGSLGAGLLAAPPAPASSTGKGDESNSSGNDVLA
jgi:hypothetical protein